MIVRIHGIDVRTRPRAIALAAVALAVGAILLAFGIVLLLGVAAIGTVVGGVVLVARAISGRGAGRRHGSGANTELDPALEVFPVDHAAAKPLRPHDSASSEAHGPD